MTEEKPKIYLAGSFFDFRDKIITALPEHNFSDPRKHRQHSIASLVEDDMGEAKESPILLACFPKGKSRGVMTYAEIGASFISGNYIAIADENEKKDDSLEKIADYKTGSIDEAIEFMKYSWYNMLQHPAVKEENNKNNGNLNILLTTNQNYFTELKNIQENGKKVFYVDDLESTEEIGKMDLTITMLPKGEEIDRRAVAFMGMAYALQIPNILIEENPVKYPPLLGLARRVFDNKDIAISYLSQLKSQKIDDEAKIMYDLFKRYNVK